VGFWVCGFGFWCLGSGPKPQNPNPQSPIPNPQSPINWIKIKIEKYKNIFNYKYLLKK